MGKSEQLDDYSVFDYVWYSFLLGLCFFMPAFLIFVMDTVMDVPATENHIVMDFLQLSYHIVIGFQFESIVRKLSLFWVVFVGIGVMLKLFLSVRLIDKTRPFMGGILITFATSFGIFVGVALIAHWSNSIENHLYSFFINNFKDIFDFDYPKEMNERSYLIIFENLTVFNVVHNGICAVLIAGFGLTKIYRFMKLIIYSVLFPILYASRFEKGSVLWGKFILEGMKLIVDTIVGMGLLIYFILTNMNDGSLLGNLLIGIGFLAFVSMVMVFLKKNTPKLLQNNNRRYVAA
ncbi:hypothetical protein [Paenibacillus polymyxa]|uniref:Uncharacterized protein n=1 Tax=Paenibacillus polymyxa (strain SC2) TaxID=886882 RepID=E3EL46_PAEPS|nr:hypothetical protein [Paenibacillus polymyxa]ADO59608.1 hypothetical protein PPSC2_27100 [Paenibacillus polymyxa SC2]WPQ59569.1 hypothetical protein SKN87_28305 [Paenibacillus polymyxa]